MPELLQFQVDFAAALRDASSTARTQRWLAGDAAHAEQRVAIYRANMVAAAEKALAAAYPVARQVVGDEFFHGLAREHQRETPSTSGDLHDFGAGFAPFLAAFEHARHMPWLPDLARLEWAAHRAYGAQDGPAWDASALMAIAAADHGAIRFDWSPGATVIASPYPVVRIWTIHQPGHAGEFAVDWEVAECALVARDGFIVTVNALTPAEAAFMTGSLDGASLADASTAALQVDPGFDLGALLARSIAAHHICGFALLPDQQEPIEP